MAVAGGALCLLPPLGPLLLWLLPLCGLRCCEPDDGAIIIYKDPCCSLIS